MMHVILFCVAGAQQGQWAITKLAAEDTNRALGYHAFQVTRRCPEDNSNTLMFAEEEFKEGEDDILGWTQAYEKTWEIAIRPQLKNARLYEVLVHEFGHVLGLNHVQDSRHIMSGARDRGSNDEPPTFLQRKKRSRQIAQSVLQQRFKNWKR